MNSSKSLKSDPKKIPDPSLSKEGSGSLAKKKHRIRLFNPDSEKALDETYHIHTTHGGSELLSQINYHSVLTYGSTMTLFSLHATLHINQFASCRPAGR